MFIFFAVSLRVNFKSKVIKICIEKFFPFFFALPKKETKNSRPNESCSPAKALLRNKKNSLTLKQLFVVFSASASGAFLSPECSGSSDAGRRLVWPGFQGLPDAILN